MKRTSLRRRLYQVLLEGFLLFVVAAAVVLGLAFRDVRQSLLADRAMLARTVARSVDAVLAEELQQLDRLARRDPLGAPAPASELRDFRFHSAFRLAAYVVDSTGRVLAADPRAPAPSPPTDLPDHGAVTRRREGVAALVQPFRHDGDSFRLVAEMDLADSQLGEHLRALEPTPGMHVLLVDDSGAVVASSRPADLSVPPPIDAELAEAVARREPFTGAARHCPLCGSETGAAVVSEMAPLRYAPWGAVILQHEDQVFAPEEEARVALATLAGLLALTALLLTWGLSRSIVTPITRLSEQAVRLRAGELNEPIAVAGDHEIEMLAGTLDEVRRRVADTLDEIHALNKDLERKVEERTAAMQELLRRLLGATEEERRRIARELHDKTAQLLTALEMALDGMEGAPVDRARHILAETHREVRDLIHDLRPSLLDDLGLAAAVRAYANEHLKPRGLRVSFEIENDVSVSPEVDITVFRILQEIITNVLRHADAESVSIELFQADGRLTLAVDDDGVGFDASAPGGLGLTGLRERATLIGGTILFDSEPGNGTHVRLEVPVLTPGGPTGRKEATP